MKYIKSISQLFESLKPDTWHYEFQYQTTLSADTISEYENDTYCPYKYSFEQFKELCAGITDVIPNCTLHNNNQKNNTDKYKDVDVIYDQNDKHYLGNISFVLQCNLGNTKDHLEFNVFLEYINKISDKVNTIKNDVYQILSIFSEDEMVYAMGVDMTNDNFDFYIQVWQWEGGLPSFTKKDSK